MTKIDAAKICKLLPKGWSIEFTTRRTLKRFRDQDTPVAPAPVELSMPFATIIPNSANFGERMTVAGVYYESAEAAIKMMLSRETTIEKI